MKLRLNDGSLRLRLSQSEVNAVINGKVVKESLNFGVNGGYFNYLLLVSSEANEIYATIKSNEIRITVPESQVMDWAKTDMVGLYNQPNNSMTIAIEKDFQCLHQRVGEDETDNYPNPKAKVN